jgi:hypothetical protein
MSRLVCQFSCGAASAVATKLILAENDPERVLIVNAFIVEEHADNRRFAGDCESWFGHAIEVLRDTVYSASTREVWRRLRFMKRFRFAPCSHHLKRNLLSEVTRPGDVTVLGYTAEEEDRLWSMEDKYPGEVFRAPLIERNLTKEDCLAIVRLRRSTRQSTWGVSTARPESLSHPNSPSTASRSTLTRLACV